MKNLFVSLLLSVVSFVTFCQKFTVKVTEVKDYFYSDSVSYDFAMKNSEVVHFERVVNGTYVIDLKANTMIYNTLIESGTRTINHYTKNDGSIVVSYVDDYFTEIPKNQLIANLIINQTKGSVVYTFYDPIYKYTFVQDFTKNIITKH